MKNLFIFRALCRTFSGFKHTVFSDAAGTLNLKNCILQNPKFKIAFSLVEMLMALLVASLLMAALAPVMTRKMNDGMTVSVEGTVPGEKTKIHEINYGVNECTEIKTDTDGSEYCEGTYIVPSGFNGNLKVTLIGAGGGGGTAPTAGYVEYITVGNNQSFKVPALVNNIETTLVSGGAGGGAGGQTKVDIPYNTPGEFTWNVPSVVKNKYAIITGCGGGGGGGGFITANYISGAAGGLGGGGGYFSKAALINNNNYSVIIGGGGGGGASAGSSGYATYTGVGAMHQGLSGTGGGGGGGGGDAWTDHGATGGLGGKNGGTGGHAREASTKLGFGGERGDTSLASNSDGHNGVIGSNSSGGTGASSGGAALWANFLKPDGTVIPHGQGGGGGGGSVTGYGGGGGGGGCGGPGGGGGGGATIFGTRANPVFLAAGGGGGGGGGIDDYDYTSETRYPNEDYYNGTSGGARWHGGGGGGGGGGGTGGGNGGNGGRANIGHAQNGGNAAGYSASTVFGANYCNGGTAFQTYAKSWLRNAVQGGSGKPGAMRITYLNYGSGGGGGGAGQIVPLQSVVVTPNEVLNVQVGQGRAGGTPGKINSDGSITEPTWGQGANTDNAHASKLLRGSTVLLATCMDAYWHGIGAYGGNPSGVVHGWNSSPWSGSHGGITTGVPTQDASSGRQFVTINGFSNTDGGGSTTGQPGGNGGSTELFGSKTHCSPGVGGTSTSIAGKNATGYGGCAGGGGYSFGAGGSGTGGYARISWNKKWNPDTKEYVLQDGSTGGGGASGNILTYSIPVKSGDRVKITIGKGGKGGYIQNNIPVDAQNGGMTTFKNLKAGGGKRDSNAVINTSDNTITNGIGGSVSGTCHNASTPLFDNAAYCTKGAKGADGAAKAGGNGAVNKYGTSGAGGIRDTSENSNGKNAAGYGAGGGGAAIRDLDKLENPAQSASNTIVGGNGSNGKIILEWRE